MIEVTELNCCSGFCRFSRLLATLCKLCVRESNGETIEGIGCIRLVVVHIMYGFPVMLVGLLYFFRHISHLYHFECVAEVQLFIDR